MPTQRVTDDIKLSPASEFIVVKLDQDSEERMGRIVIPPTAAPNKKTQTGVVAAVGPGRRDPTNIERRIPIDCEVGQRVLLACFIGYPLKIKGDEFVIVKHNDIMAQVEEVFHYEEGSEED